MAQSGDIGIDLGTSNVVIYMKGHGVVFREPSIIAVERESSQIIAFGMEAYRMIGRTPANISIIRPLAQGEILDFDLTASMLRYYISNVIGKKFFSRPRAIMSVPSGVKEIEKKALITSMFDAGLRRITDVHSFLTAVRRFFQPAAIRRLFHPPAVRRLSPPASSCIWQEMYPPDPGSTE